MQTFKDSATNKIYQYEDDVDVSKLASAPLTLEPYTIPVPTQADLDSLAVTAKWKLVDDYMSTLEITSDVSVGGHKFNVSPQGIINIQNAMRGMVSADTKYWVENWATFNTDLVEMEWVLKETERLRDLKIVEVGL